MKRTFGGLFQKRGEGEAGTGNIAGEPVYYIRAAFSGKSGRILAGTFAALIILALGFMGNAVQSNSIASAFHTAFDIPQWAMGIFVAVISLFVFPGGMRRIARVTETIVPIMAGLYILDALIVIIYHFREIPCAFYSIVVGAFSPSAITGGAVRVYSLLVAVCVGLDSLAEVNLVWNMADSLIP